MMILSKFSRSSSVQMMTPWNTSERAVELEVVLQLEAELGALVLEKRRQSLIELPVDGGNLARFFVGADRILQLQAIQNELVREIQSGPLQEGVDLRLRALAAGDSLGRVHGEDIGQLGPEILAMLVCRQTRGSPRSAARADRYRLRRADPRLDRFRSTVPRRRPRSSAPADRRSPLLRIRAPTTSR